jgi:hypothetical protein
MAAENPTHAKWVCIACIPGILALLMLFAACSQDSIRIGLRADDIVAIAFPEDLPAREIAASLASSGFDTIMTEDNVMVPVTDFVRLEYLSLSEVSRRVEVDDPRHTPLTSLLVSSFSTSRADESWRIWYIPVDSGSEYAVIQDLLTGIGSDWAWDAQPDPPGLRFLWIIWLVWILWLLATRPVKDRLFHGVLIAAWLPLAFIQSLVAAALMIVGQGISAILGMNILASGRKYRIDRNGIHRLLTHLSPFLLSMSFLLSLDTPLLAPVAASALMLFMMTKYSDKISGFLEKGRIHQKPPFRLILDDSIKGKAARLGLWALLPLVTMMILVSIIPSHAGNHSDYQLVFNTDPLQRTTTLDNASMIRSHTAYQEALTWGRLGEASWMTDTYTRPFRFEVQNDRIVRGMVDKGSHTDVFQNSNELDRELMRILDHTQGGVPLVVQGDEIPVNSTAQLDSLGVVFYIMALAPFCVLGLRRVGQSRRRIITSYLNRQVA